MILQFDNFEIQPIKETDFWKICDLMVVNQDRFKSYFPGTLAENLTPDLSKLFCEKKVKQFSKKEEFLFPLKDSETRELAGLIYIKELDWTKKQGEFAYCLGSNFSGKSLMTKAVKELSKLAFAELGLETLQIIVFKENLPSVNVALNNEFVWHKTLLNEFIPPNSAPLDMELYELYKD